MLKITMALAVALLAAPAALAAPPAQAVDRQNATRDCRVLRADMGTATFRATYGQQSAFRRCVRQWTAEERSNRVNAAQACRTERGTTPESRAAFRAKYGGGANAFGKCVSQARRAEAAEDREATMNAAQTCKAERGTTTESKAAFRAKYGGGANAFGKCVSTLAKSQNDS